MDITPEEAQSALNDIQRLGTRARQMGGNIAASYMLVWGVVWTIGFSSSQFFARWIIWILVGTLIVGITGSAILGSRQGKTTRLAPGSREAFVSAQVGIFQGILYGFAILWLIVFHLTLVQVGMLWITTFTLGSIVSGFWFRQKLPIIGGIIITLVLTTGYYLFPQYFWLWAAVSAGLPLVGLGLYLLLWC